MPIIKSLLDTDFYKFTMAQAVYHNYPVAIVKYKFKCRNNKNIPYEEEIKKEIDHLCTLRFQEKELSFLSSFPFFTKDFIRFLRFFQLNRNYIKIYNDENLFLHIDIEGPWISTIFFEVPTLAIVSEVYCKHKSVNLDGEPDIEWTMKEGNNILENKINHLSEHLKTGHIAGFKFADFGTRRRYSRKWQEKIIEALKEQFRHYLFVGTSNVYFAQKYGLKPIGTMAHEWVQAHQQLGPILKQSQKHAFDVWCQEYRGRLGTAISDTLGAKLFLKDFDLYFAKLFDGCRHDSGDPVSWCVKLIEHYDKLGIDPKTKTAVFSDKLDFETAIELHEMFHDLINVSFAIGTNLTNDLGITPLQIVLKMVECNGKPVAKIPDTWEKGVCEDAKYLTILKKEIKYKR